MVFLRQTHLGSTSKCLKSLTIVDLPSDESSSSKDTRTFIFQLPDELLVPILEFAASEPDVWQHGTKYKNGVLLALSRVCQRLRRVAQQLLYRHLCVKKRMALSAPMVPPGIPVVKLHRTLRGREDLRQHCRSLHVHIPDVGSPPKDANSYLVAEDLVDWLTNTRDLTIHGGFEDDSQIGDEPEGSTPPGDERTWSLIRRMAANFKNLEYLELSRESWGLYLPDVFECVKFPRLKSLRLHGISEAKHKVVELAPEALRTAPFTTLSISDWTETPHATRLFLHWPKTLSSFTFGSFYSNPHTITYPMFETWLLPHAHTLTHIDIGYLRSPSRLLNATLFPNLEFLRLSRWQMSAPVSFLDEEDANILGPSLKTFSWSFSIYDQHNEGWCAFGDAEENWLRRLGECAKKRGAVLEKIEILFCPDHWGTTEVMGYPWDRMIRVREETLRPGGVELVYSEPMIGKTEWLEFVRREDGEDGGDEMVGEDAAENQLDSGVDEEDDEEALEPEFQYAAYQGEDIREYLITLPEDL